MELMMVLRVLLRRWYLILIPVVIAAAITLPDVLNTPGATGGYSTVIRYTAAQVLTAIPERDGDYQDVWLASELTVNAFTDWVRSANFAHEVDAILAAQGLTITTHGIYAADNDRSLGQIFIQGNDADLLKQIGDAAVEVLQTRSGAYFPQLGDAPAEVKILEAPMIFSMPPAITNRLRPLLQIALAVFAGIGLAFLAEYFDPFLRRREQLESLGMSVIGSIPRE